MNRTKKIFAFALGWAVSFACLAQAPPSTYPDKPLRLVAPFPAGTGDNVFRLITEPLAEVLGKPIVFDYKTGASGTIGLSVLAHSDPDGHSIGIGNSDGVALAPNYYSKLSYDPIKDLQPVAIVAEMPLIVLVRADSPVKSFKDLVAMAKAKPGTVTYGTPGSGSVPNIVGALLSKESGVTFTQVPYKGTSPALQDLYGGHITFAITSGFDAVPGEKAGRTRAILVTGTSRYPLLPNTPSAKEIGYNSVDELTVWFGLFAPAATARPIIDKLAREIDRIIAKDEYKNRSAEMGFVPIRTTPDQFKARVRDDVARFAALVKLTGVKSD